MDNKFVQHQNHLLSLLQETDFDLIALNPSPTLFYLSGLDFHLMERPILFLFSKYTSPIIFLPELETGKINPSDNSLQVISYGEDPASWLGQFQKCLNFLDKAALSKIGVEPTSLRFLEFEFLQATFPSSEFCSCQILSSALRMNKDEEERKNILKAVKIAEEGLTHTLPFIKPGVTEREIANELVVQLIQAGADPQMPFNPIIASGENSANPHAVPTDRKIQTDDVLVIDWGAKYHGYISDLTRTFAIGKIKPDLERIYAVVKRANEIGRQYVSPNISAGDIDQAVRDSINQAGLGKHFFHRTGHGIGLETHEEPYIRMDNQMILQPGMTFTIEPGVYLENNFGVRIEDNVIVTKSGGETLSNFSRNLMIL